MNDAQFRSTKRKLKILMDTMQDSMYLLPNSQFHINKQDVGYWIRHWEVFTPESRLEIMQRCNQVWKQLPTSAPYMRHI